jgi:ribosomal-protein-alanine N-acetyltransferase
MMAVVTAPAAAPPIAPDALDVSDVPNVRRLPMTPARLPAVLAIEQVSHGHPWTRGNFLDALHTGWHAQCLLAGDQLLGYFVAMSGVDEAHLLNLTVAPAYRGQGWARVMLEALALWARATGAQALWLEVRLSNTRALWIYEQYGFRRVSVRKGYYPAADVGAGANSVSNSASSAREDAVVMSCQL